MKQTKKNFFPLFLDLRGKKILIFGGGTVAARRIHALFGCGAWIKVIAPEISKDILQLEKKCREKKTEETKLSMEYRNYQRNEIRDADFVFAATNDSTVNTAIYRECRHKEILVNVASDRKLCSFYFPAIIERDEMLIGLVSGGENHKKAAEMRKKIEWWLEQEECDATDSNCNKRK